MTNKVKKRVISDLDVAGNSENAKRINQETKKGIKKSKIKVDTISNVAKKIQSIKPQQIDNANGSKKLTKKEDNSKSGFQVTNVNPSDIKSNQDKVVDENTINKKKLKKLKEKQLKREKRKQFRKEHGQYNVKITMSNEVMRQRIDEIQSRENLTKTAKRKLSILKKKLSIAEGTSLPPNQNTQVSEIKSSKLTKGQKKKLRQEKLMSQNKEQNQKGSSNISNVQKIKEKQVVSDVKKIGKNKIKIPNKSDEESFEEKNESDVDDSEDESSVEASSQLIEEEKSIEMNVDDSSDGEEEEEEEEEEGEEEEEEDDDNDAEDGADNDEENVESEDESDDDITDMTLKKEVTVQKVKKAKKNLDTKFSNQENGEKKKRYVLFVGNIPFKATVEDIKQHFLQKVTQVSSVRIPTIKGTKRPRGFAYVEVTNNIDYETALALHQTTLQGFKINVEYTQTGSKNIKNKQELVAKNKKLHAIRKVGKLAGSHKGKNRTFRRNMKKNQEALQG